MSLFQGITMRCTCRKCEYYSTVFSEGRVSCFGSLLKIPCFLGVGAWRAGRKRSWESVKSFTIKIHLVHSPICNKHIHSSPCVDTLVSRDKPLPMSSLSLRSILLHHNAQDSWIVAAMDSPSSGRPCVCSVSASAT